MERRIINVTVVTNQGVKCYSLGDAVGDSYINMAASTAKNLALSPSGTKGKMLIARVIEEYASLQCAEMKKELEDLQLRQKRIDAANEVYRDEIDVRQKECAEMKKQLDEFRSAFIQYRDEAIALRKELAELRNTSAGFNEDHY